MYLPHRYLDPLGSEVPYPDRWRRLVHGGRGGQDWHEPHPMQGPGSSHNCDFRDGGVAPQCHSAEPAVVRCLLSLGPGCGFHGSMKVTFTIQARGTPTVDDSIDPA